MCRAGPSRCVRSVWLPASPGTCAIRWCRTRQRDRRLTVRDRRILAKQFQKTPLPRCDAIYSFTYSFTWVEKPSPDWETGSHDTPDNTHGGKTRETDKIITTNEKSGGKKKAGSPRKIRLPARAEDTRFELVRLLHQHAFQACAIDH